MLLGIATLVDWLSHGRNATADPWQVPLPPNGDWPENPMRILRTLPDPTQPLGPDGYKPRLDRLEELNPEWVDQLRSVYDNDLGSVDLMVGLYAERATRRGLGSRIRRFAYSS